MDTELRLTVPPAALERTRSHSLLAARAQGAPREHHLLDTYYDTLECDLWKHGLTLRVRNDNGAWMQTIETNAGAPSSPIQRSKWESALPEGQPQPGLLARQVKPAALAAALANAGIAGKLQPVFRCTIHRTAWDIALPDGRQLTCALDVGDIVCCEHHAPVSELELTLMGGDPARLFELALALHEEIALEPGQASHAARGYALFLDEAAHAIKAGRVRLERHMTLEDAFQRIGLHCLHQVDANLPGVLRQDPESLHQMRVGLRRLRALLAMFKKLAALPEELQQGVDWLAGELAAPRDWDVLSGTTLDAAAGSDLGALRQAAGDKAGALHEQLQRTLRSPRHTTLMLRLNGWLRSRQWRPAGAPPEASPLAGPARRGIMPMMRKAEKRLRKRIKALDVADAPARHRVRIAAKKARYAAEFLHDLLPPRRTKRYIKRLSALQDRLGELNDMAVADRLLDGLGAGRGPSARQASWVRGFLYAKASADCLGLAKDLKRVAKLRITR